MKLSETSLRVWRAVAARGRLGIGSAQLHDHFAGQIDSDPLGGALLSLRRGGYVRNNSNGKFSTWWAADRVPLGEDRPPWLDEPETEADAELAPEKKADDVLASARRLASTGGTWPFGAKATGADAAGDEPKAPPAPVTVAAPWFALDSEGCLSLRTEDIDARLSADATRALFVWLDQLSGMPAFADLVGAES